MKGVRNKQYLKIEQSMALYGYNYRDHKHFYLSDRFDYVFFCGDLNYRVERTREYVDSKLQNLDIYVPTS
jgi:hypothetical protein